MADAFTFYCDAAGRYPLLTAAQEIALGRDIQGWLTHPDYPNVPPQVERRGRRARDKMARSNLRLVISLARNLQRRLIAGPFGSFDFSDLVQEGNIGLMRAIDKYDPNRGYRFSTYACWWIRQSMRRGMETKQRTMRPPAGVANALERYNRVLRDEANRLGRLPTQAEVQAALGLSDSEWQGFLHLRYNPMSLDNTNVSGYDDLRLVDCVADPTTTDLEGALDEIQLDFWRQALKKGWGILSMREKSMLVEYYGLDGEEPQSLQKLAQNHKLTREACRQQIKKSQLRLRFFGSDAVSVA